MGSQFYTSLDIELTLLVNRLRALGYQRILELEFRYGLDFAKMVSAMGPDGFLPKFRENGRMTVSETRSKRVLYCSDGLLGSGLDSGGSNGSETDWAAPTPMVPQGGYRFSAIA